MRQKLTNCASALNEAFFGYETQKVVQINSLKIGILYRVIQISILVYISLWVMYYERGYQAFDTAVNGVMIKVMEGLMLSNLSMGESMSGIRIWDAADYVVPSQQNAAIFVTTNAIITHNQTLGYCAESKQVPSSYCWNNSMCPEGHNDPYGNGIYTGKCLIGIQPRRCEVFAWCPTQNEDDGSSMHVDIPLSHMENIKVLVKNSIEFPRFHTKRRNILPWMTKEYLTNCHYNATDSRDKYCPIFRVGELFRFTKTDVAQLLEYGGSVAISINWSCNLDYADEYCLPKYTFSRLDDINHQQLGQGWNFRHAYEYREHGKVYRTLIKAYGVQFIVLVTGKGGRFDVLNFTMNIGSGLALLGAASLCCDLIVLHFLKNKKRYREAKFDLFQKVPKPNPQLLSLNHYITPIVDADMNPWEREPALICPGAAASHNSQSYVDADGNSISDDNDSSRCYQDIYLHESCL